MTTPPRSRQQVLDAVRAVHQSNGNKSAASKILGIPRQTFCCVLEDAERRWPGCLKPGWVEPEKERVRVKAPGRPAREEPPPDPYAEWRLEHRSLPPAYTGGAVYEFPVGDDNTLTFGACGDAHLGSKYERIDVLNKLYDAFAAAGCTAVFNTGNWIDGEASFNVHDLHTHGLDAQCRYLARVYPRRNGITTYAVTGDDHEGWYAQRQGVDIGRYAEQCFHDDGRSDWVDLGYMEAPILLQNASGKAAVMSVVHPGGGSAYALSYSVQKIIESLDGGEKPALALYGHYHKLWFGNIRNVWAIQTGCFLGATKVETDTGPRKIRDIKVGDLVLTHANRLRRVTGTFSRMYRGELIELNYGRRGRPDQTLTMTVEHPVLVERNGARDWVPAMFVQPGDRIFVLPGKCSVTGEPVPYWLKMGRNGNPMHLGAVRSKLSGSKGGFKRSRGGSAGERHLHADVIPFCRRMEAEGWRMVPVGGQVIPDAIGYKDGRLVAFEIEKATGNYREFKRLKYQTAEIGNFIDEVVWEYLDAPKEQPRPPYEFDEATGLVLVDVLAVIRKPIKGAHDRKKITVYNLSVEDDESYIAGRVAVHNCTQDQTPFMRKKKLEAHVGGALVKVTQDPETGALVRCQVELLRFFHRGYYVNRWNHHGPVAQPPLVRPGEAA